MISYETTALHYCKILTSRSRVLEKPTVAQMYKKCFTSYESRRFITVFTRASHWSLFWATWMQSTPSQPIFQDSF